MMSKFLSSFLVLLLVCAICGCQTAVPGPSGYIELTEDEIQELINEARANAGYTGAVKKRKKSRKIFRTTPKVQTSNSLIPTARNHFYRAFLPIFCRNKLTERQRQSPSERSKHSEAVHFFRFQSIYCCGARYVCDSTAHPAAIRQKKFRT